MDALPGVGDPHLLHHLHVIFVDFFGDWKRNDVYNLKIGVFDSEQPGQLCVLLLLEFLNGQSLHLVEAV